MEELFKSLSESVSEECYSDIMGIVEDILSYIPKVHGRMEWDEDGEPANKSAELKRKVSSMQKLPKQVEITKYTPKVIKKRAESQDLFITPKNVTKNEAGEGFTKDRREGFPYKLEPTKRKRKKNV